MYIYVTFSIYLSFIPPNFFGSHLLGSATNKVLSYANKISLISLLETSSTTEKKKKKFFNPFLKVFNFDYVEKIKNQSRKGFSQIVKLRSQTLNFGNITWKKKNQVKQKNK